MSESELSLLAKLQPCMFRNLPDTHDGVFVLVRNPTVFVTMTRMMVGEIEADLSKLPAGLMHRFQTNMMRRNSITFELDQDTLCSIIRANWARLGPPSRHVSYEIMEMNDCLRNRPHTYIKYELYQSDVPIINTLVAAHEASIGVLANLVMSNMHHRPTAEKLEKCALELHEAIKNGHVDGCTNLVQHVIGYPMPWKNAVQCVYAVYAVVFTLPGRIAVKYTTHGSLKQASLIECSPSLQAQLQYLGP